jgi:hypothetical protein
MTALDYVQGRMTAVEGFLAPLDAGLMMALDLAQQGLGLDGDLAEIGVCQGRSAILLAHLAKAGERVHAIDVFDLHWPNPPYNDPDRFIGNVLAQGIDLARFNVIKTDTTLDADRALAGLGEGRTRLFHIDGDHRLVNILADARIALKATHRQGALVFDDVFSYLMPEVTEGLLRILAGRADFVPLALTPQKLYVVAAALKAHYARYLIECLAGNVDPVVRRLLDGWVLTFTPTETTRLFRFADAAAGPADRVHRAIQARAIDFKVPD